MLHFYGENNDVNGPDEKKSARLLSPNRKTQAPYQATGYRPYLQVPDIATVKERVRQSEGLSSEG
jgi:hypothetical protein